MTVSRIGVAFAVAALVAALPAIAEEPGSEPATVAEPQVGAASEATKAEVLSWMSGMEARLRLSARHPAAADPFGGALGFRLSGDGRASDIALLHPSGSAALDRAALRALRSVGDLPAAPAELRGRRIVWRYMGVGSDARDGAGLEAAQAAATARNLALAGIGRTEMLAQRSASPR